MPRTYSSVWKGHKTSTPGGLHKEDIIRRHMKGPVAGPRVYRYVSRARHDVAVQRMRAFGLPPGFEEHKIPKRYNRPSGSRRRSRRGGRR